MRPPGCFFHRDQVVDVSDSNRMRSEVKDHRPISQGLKALHPGQPMHDV
jgi:hypothetical protein